MPAYIKFLNTISIAWVTKRNGYMHRTIVIYGITDSTVYSGLSQYDSGGIYLRKVNPPTAVESNFKALFVTMFI